MHKKIIIQLELFILIFGFGCQQLNFKNEGELLTYDLGELPKTTTLKLSDLEVDDIKYIPLETNEECFIPEILGFNLFGKLFACKDYYIVKYFTTILKFGKDGSFIAKIGKEGRGPGEFLVAHDIDVDQKSQQIYIVDGWARKFYIYSENGDFIRTFPAPVNTNEFVLTKNGILCYSTDIQATIKNSYNLIDTNGVVIWSFPNKYPWKLSSSIGTAIFNENIFYTSSNKIFTKEVCSDTVYEYNNNTFKPHLVILHGKKLLNPRTRTASDPRDLLDNYIDQVSLFEFGDYIYYEFKYGHSQYSFIASKKKNFQVLTKNDFQNETSRYTGFINDIDGGPDILPITIKDDNSIISLISALNLKAFVSSEKFKSSRPQYPDKKKDLEKLAQNLKEDDNPILIVLKLKK